MDPAYHEALLLYNSAMKTHYKTVLDVARTNCFIGLIDRQELPTEEAEWGEVEPYIRILGVSSKDVWEANGDFTSEDIHDLQSEIPKIELQLQDLYRSIQNIVGKDPVSVLTKINRSIQEFPENFRRIREKQGKCLQGHIENTQSVHSELSEIKNLLSGDQDNIELAELEHKIDISSLKRQIIEKTLLYELYNESTVPALEYIRNQLETMIDKQEDLKSILSSRIERYESNPTLVKLTEKYSSLLQAISAKRKDLNNLSN